jgi:hypothetical protein
MLWHKSWLESRSRFLIGLGILMMMAAGTVVDYRSVERLLPLVRSMDASRLAADNPLARLIRQGIEVQRDYRGFVWWQWFRDNLAHTWTLFAVLLGSGGLLPQGSGGETLFTLSLPVSRNRLIGVRTATNLAELFVLAIGPSLVIPALSPTIGQQYAIADVAVHGLCLFVSGAAFFSLAILLSTVFGDLWRPLLITCAVAVALAMAEFTARQAWPYGPFSLMSGEAYLTAHTIPWAGLLASATVAAAILYAAARNFAIADF